MSNIKKGDILAAKRIGYYHFAVYIGNDRVIHYASDSGDFGGEITIHEAPFEEFQKDSDEIYVLEFPEYREKPKYHKVSLGRLFGSSSMMPGSIVEPDWTGYYALKFGKFISELIKNEEYHLYSAEETVARAKSKLGEKEYSLPFNNCEHFAIWCKTGVKESWQVEKLADELIEAANPYRNGRKY